jgi:hypothetical protein
MTFLIFRRSIYLVAVLAMCAISHAAEAPADSPALNAGVGRLWNLTPEVLVYQLGRTSGSPWSDPIALPPGQSHEVRAPRPGERSPLLGLSDRERFVVVRFRALGGVVKVRLPARTPEGEIVPNWFFVKDANSVPRLIQAVGPEQARAEYERLKSQRPLQDSDLVRLRESLRANHVFSDGP